MIIGIVPKTIFLLLVKFSDINLEIAIGRDKVAIVMNKLKVGIIKVYKPIPSRPIILVVIILITIPKILVIKPPIIKIIVPLINFSFKNVT